MIGFYRVGHAELLSTTYEPLSVIDKEIPVANPVKIDLVNVSGISVFSAQEVTFPYMLRLKGINPGIYFLKIHFSEGFTNQIIVVK